MVRTLSTMLPLGTIAPGSDWSTTPPLPERTGRS